MVHLWDAVRLPPDENFPFVLDHLCAFVWWRDGIGEIRTRIEIVDAANNAVIFRSRDFLANFHKRRSSIWASYRLVKIDFPTPGSCLVELYCFDQFVDDQVIRVFEN